MLTVIAKREQRLFHASCLVAFAAFGCKGTTFISFNDKICRV